MIRKKDLESVGTVEDELAFFSDGLAHGGQGRLKVLLNGDIVGTVQTQGVLVDTVAQLCWKPEQRWLVHLVHHDYAVISTVDVSFV